MTAIARTTIAIDAIAKITTLFKMIFLVLREETT